MFDNFLDMKITLEKLTEEKNTPTSTNKGMFKSCFFLSDCLTSVTL